MSGSRMRAAWAVTMLCIHAALATEVRFQNLFPTNFSSSFFSNPVAIPSSFAAAIVSVARAADGGHVDLCRNTSDKHN